MRKEFTKILQKAHKLLTWKYLYRSLIFGTVLFSIWYLITSEIILGLIFCSILTLFNWLDQNYKGPKSRKNMFEDDKIKNVFDEGGLHSLSVYSSLGKGYESHYLHTQALNRSNNALD